MSEWLSLRAYRYQGSKTVLNQLWAGLTSRQGEGGKLISVVLEHKFLVVRGWISFWLRDVAVASSLFQEGEPTKMWYLALSILLMPSITDK